MPRYSAVWDDDLQSPLNGSVVLTDQRFACDWKDAYGAMIAFVTTSTDGVHYVGSVLEPRQAVGTFTQPVQSYSFQVEFRRHRPTKSEPWERMEYQRWSNGLQEANNEELADILLLPIGEVD